MFAWWKNCPQKIDVEGTDSYKFVVNQNCVNKTGVCGCMGWGHDSHWRSVECI